MAENIVSLEKLQARLTANPFNAWMGLAITALDEETIEVTMSWREEMVSNPQARRTHGGVLSALVDVAADFMIAAKVGAPAPTVDLRVDFHRAAAPGDLRAVGRVIRIGGTFSTAEATVYDSEDRLIASGRGLYYTAPPKT